VTRYVVPILVPPDAIQLSRRTKKDVRAAERAAQRMNAELKDDALMPFLLRGRQQNRAPVRRLSHRLVGHFSENRSDADRLGVHENDRSQDECVIAKRTHNDLARAIDRQDFSLFRNHLETVNASVRNLRTSELRTGSVTSIKDRNGAYWEFPSPDDAIDMIRQLFVYLCKGRDTPLVAACVAFCIVPSAHPFADGNGRTGRILLNQVLSMGLDQEIRYIPFKEISRTLDSTHVLYLRELRMTKRWEPMCSYLSSMILLYDVYQRDQMRRRASR
jgi:Fic family protein